MDTSSWSLRQADEADVPRLAELYARCAREMGPLAYDAQQVEAWASFGRDTPAFRDYVLKARTWIARDATEAVLGFCGVGAAGEVHSLYVRPDLTRRGLGSALLAHAMAQARTAGTDAFSAWATPLSRPVFERAGFILREIRREPYQGVVFERYRLERPAGA